jgi:hypothetical protein
MIEYINLGLFVFNFIMTCFFVKNIHSVLGWLIAVICQIQIIGMMP